jgi:uncharacterized protein
MKGLIPLLLICASACSDGATERAARGSAVASETQPAVALTGRVTDAAGILDTGLEARLTGRLAALEQRTGHQLVVVTVPSLGQRDVAAFTLDLANAWGIGRAEQDDGVVLLVAPNERRVRIEVGKGLENVLTNALCEQILASEILPRFRSGDLPAGIEAGTDALTRRLQ